MSIQLEECMNFTRMNMWPEVCACACTHSGKSTQKYLHLHRYWVTVLEVAFPFDPSLPVSLALWEFFLPKGQEKVGDFICTRKLRNHPHGFIMVFFHKQVCYVTVVLGSYGKNS